MARRHQLLRGAGCSSSWSCRLLLLASCAAAAASGLVVPSAATAVEVKTADADHPSSREIQQKCGFTMEDIFECSRNRCQAVVKTCMEDDVNAAACVVKKCKEALAVCEEALISNQSAEAVCERDGFANVDTNCTVVVSNSKDTLSHCETKGYLQVRRRCFSSTWRKLLRQAATKRTGATSFTDEFFECADKNCYSQSENCPESNYAYIQNVSARDFSLDSCSYTVTSFPQECEYPACPSAIDTCFEKFSSAGHHSGLVALLVIFVLLVVAAVAFIVRRVKKHYQSNRRNPYSRVDK